MGIKSIVVIGICVGFSAPLGAWAHGDAHSPASKGAPKAAAKAPISAEETAFGKAGDPKRVSRTINIDMTDTMRFKPAQITVKQGETIRFVSKNSGKQMHEMVIGTMQELKAHSEMMRKHPGMEHDEAYMAHVAPGKAEQIVWQFTKPGEFHFGCLIPGHFEAGMIGKIVVTAK